ncbi:extensin-like [Drosophila obscura]|uniref:extensin-like n=1 Tax=Drosophila obscura TaxID=7282 RepID=UPI001BB23777|nr:extensin-like [Drosophila obscura]
MNTNNNNDDIIVFSSDEESEATTTGTEEDEKEPQYHRFRRENLWSPPPRARTPTANTSPRPATPSFSPRPHNAEEWPPAPAPETAPPGRKSPPLFTRRPAGHRHQGDPRTPTRPAAPKKSPEPPYAS